MAGFFLGIASGTVVGKRISLRFEYCHAQATACKDIDASSWPIGISQVSGAAIG
jgi:hypothetical protein